MSTELCGVGGSQGQTQGSVSPWLGSLPHTVWSKGQHFVLGWLLGATSQDQLLTGLDFGCVMQEELHRS